MKKSTVIIISLFCLFAACNTKKNAVNKESNLEPGIHTITGKVVAIEFGKDGYTAKIVTDDDVKYFATVSIPNLGINSEKYRVFEINETVSIIGEFWKLGKENRITVSNIK